MKDVAINLSEIQIIPIKPIDGHLGFVSFIINNQFYVGSIGLHSRPNGKLRLLYPQKKLANGKIVNCFHPINKKAGQLLLDQIEIIYKRLKRL